MSPSLIQTWVPQADAHGRIHLEARWVMRNDQVPNVAPADQVPTHAPLHAA